MSSIPRLHRLGPATVKCPRSADRPADPASGMPTTVHSVKGSTMPSGVCHLAARPNCTRRSLPRGNGSTASLRESVVRPRRSPNLTREETDVIVEITGLLLWPCAASIVEPTRLVQGRAATGCVKSACIFSFVPVSVPNFRPALTAVSICNMM